MSLPVAVSRRARQQLTAATRWWVSHRDETELLTEEVATASRLISAQPELGSVFTSRFPGLRRMLLRRTGYHLYYRLDRKPARIVIVAFWHSKRARGPRL